MKEDLEMLLGMEIKLLLLDTEGIPIPSVPPPIPPEPDNLDFFYKIWPSNPWPSHWNRWWPIFPCLVDGGQGWQFNTKPNRGGEAAEYFYIFKNYFLATKVGCILDTE